MSAQGADYIIDVRGLTKRFHQRVAVNGIDLQVEKGSIFGFLGPNGSGKTTTIRMLCGLLQADAGQGTCLGFDILTEAYKIKQRVGYMTQKFCLYPDLSVEENLLFIARLYGVKDLASEVSRSLQQLGLVERRQQLTGELSGGWKQRLALAACLIHHPSLLLLDEPTAGVDPIARREFWDTIHSLSDQGVTALVSTHYMDEAERCTRIAYLESGVILTCGTVNEVIAETGLHTWTITGPITTSLLQQAKKLAGVEQAVLFGNTIHVCSHEEARIEKHLAEFCQSTGCTFEKTPTTLEDAFISLVNQSELHRA